VFRRWGSLKAGQNTSYTLDIIRDIALLVGSLFVVMWPITKYAADDVVRSGWHVDPTTQRVGPRRTKEAQRRLAALQEQRRREATKRVIAASASVAVVLLAVGFIGIGVQANRVGNGSGPVAAPSIATGGGILIGNPKAKTTVDLYEDFLCPVCKEFESGDSATIAQAVKDGTANFRYHPIAILDNSTSPTGYSTRAAAAAACMPDTASWQKFHDLLYANQPAEGSAGLTNAKLIQLGKQAGGKDPTFSQCVNGQTYKGWVSQLTDDSSKANVSGTPTVRIKGKDVTGANGTVPSAADLTNAITAGHGNTSEGQRGKGSNAWVVILVVVIVIGVGAALAWRPRNRRR